jgi:hypothetical protein
LLIVGKMRKRCKNCNKRRSTNLFRSYRSKSGKILIRGNCIECEGSLRREREHKSLITQIKTKIRRKRYRSTPKGRFVNAQQRARKKNIYWSLTRDEYMELIQNNCFYCNGFFPPVKTGIGLDRKSSKQGYIIGNVVACCEICNKIKNNFLTPDEAKAAVSAIIQIREKK